MNWQAATKRVLGTCVDTFTTEATYVRASGAGSFAVRGVFDEKSRDVQPLELGIQATEPKFGVKLEDLPVPPGPGDQLTIGSVSYKIVRSEPDGEAGTVLYLHRIE